jgi:bacillithiol system protein YtxJ
MHARWTILRSLSQLDDVLRSSSSAPQVIFKHSTRCIISKMALEQLEDNLSEIPEHANLLLLDLLNHRDVSSAIAEKLRVHHESPQVVVIKNGEAVFHESHHSIDAHAIAKYC